MGKTILELTVSHHPGILPQVCGLLARRGHPPEGMLYLANDGDRHGRLWLRLGAGQGVEQLRRQLEKLVDVREVRALAAESASFERLPGLLVAPVGALAPRLEADAAAD